MKGYLLALSFLLSPLCLNASDLADEIGSLQHLCGAQKQCHSTLQPQDDTNVLMQGRIIHVERLNEHDLEEEIRQIGPGMQLPQKHAEGQPRPTAQTWLPSLVSSHSNRKIWLVSQCKDFVSKHKWTSLIFLIGLSLSILALAVCIPRMLGICCWRKGAEPATSSGVDKSKPADPVSVAVVWVEKARSGSMQWTNLCTQRQLQAYRLKKRLKPVTVLVKYALLGMAFIEVPSYCIPDPSQCPSSSRPELHGSGTPMLPTFWTNAMAIFLWVYMIYHLWLRKEALGDAHEVTTWHIIGAVCIVIGLLDCTVSIFYEPGLMWWNSFRVSRLVRPMVFLSQTKKVREAANRVIFCIPKILDVFLALLLTILVFSWLGLIIFGGDGEEGKAFFSSWSAAITSLYILFTTANCPDVFLLAYEKHRMVFFFFCFFMIITIYLLSNVLLASVFDAYKDQLKDMLQEFYKNQDAAMKNAFDLLADEKGKIGPAAWSHFFSGLCDSFESEGEYHEGMEHSDDVRYNRQRANHIFQIMDTDKSQTIEINEFRTTLSVIHDSENYMPRKAPPKLQNSAFTQSLKRLFEEGIDLPRSHHMSWDAFVDCVIFVDVMLVLSQTIVYVNGSGKFHMETLEAGNAFFWVLFAFSCFYVIALSLRIFVLGRERFWHMKNPVRNRYDFVTVYTIFLAEVVSLTMVMTTGEPEAMLKLLLLCHVSRSLRLLHYIHPLQSLAVFVTRLAATYYHIGMLLMVVFYMYAMIGGQWFGGRIYEGNKALVGTDFAASKYWSMNFNDFPSSMVTLFVLMVVNNWFVITNALINVTASRWAALFSVSFLTIVNMIVLNILMALLLETSVVVSEQLEREEAGEDVKANLDYEEVLRKVLFADQGQDDPPHHTSSPPAIPI